MKTLIDAVNELKGDIGNAKKFNLASHNANMICMFECGCKILFLATSDEVLANKYFSVVCTVEEFNACVDELSAATWIDGVSLEEWKAGMKNTVIDSHGNELEIGKVYEFSDIQASWSLHVLKGCNNVTDDNDYEYEANNCNWRFIRECQSPLGTIKKSPVKLVDGKAYQFENVVTGRVWVGFYNSTNDRFDESVGGIGVTCHIGNVSCFKNIIPLVPETK